MDLKSQISSEIFSELFQNKNEGDQTFQASFFLNYPTITESESFSSFSVLQNINNNDKQFMADTTEQQFIFIENNNSKNFNKIKNEKDIESNKSKIDISKTNKKN